MKAKEGHVQALKLVQRALQSTALAQKGIQWRIAERRPQVTVIEPAEPAAEGVSVSAKNEPSKKLENPVCLRNILILKPDSDNYIIRPVLALRSEPSTKEQFETEFRYRTRFLDAPGVHFPLRLGEETEASPLSADIPRDLFSLPRVTPVPTIPVDWLSNISQRNNAVVATNANFFAHAEEEFVASYSAFKEPIGFIMSDGKLLVPPACRRGVLLIDQDGQPHITRMSMRNTVIRLVKQKVGFWGEETPTDRQNPYPGASAPFFVAPFQSKDSEAKDPWTPAKNGKSSEVVLYSRAYGMRTPQSSDRIEIGVSFEWVVFVKFQGDNPIPSGGFVLSIPRYDLMKDTAKEKLVENFLPNADEVKRISIGDRAKINAYPPEEIRKQGCLRIFHAVCGLRILKESEPLPSNFFKDDVPEEWQEDFREGVTTPTAFTYSVDYEPAPRTAIGIRLNEKNEKELVIAVLDGERLHGAGYTLAGLAQFMKELGCRDAINLDGGGSSEMVVCHQVVNKPSDGWERLMPVGLVVTPSRR